jgi:hypothetical protein
MLTNLQAYKGEDGRGGEERGQNRMDPRYTHKIGHLLIHLWMFLDDGVYTLGDIDGGDGSVVILVNDARVVHGLH